MDEYEIVMGWGVTLNWCNRGDGRCGLEGTAPESLVVRYTSLENSHGRSPIAIMTKTCNLHIEISIFIPMKSI
mgnify:CR=1 FL=1